MCSLLNYMLIYLNILFKSEVASNDEPFLQKYYLKFAIQSVICYMVNIYINKFFGGIFGDIY